MFSIFNFNVKSLSCFAEAKIQEFAKRHTSEVFYAFAIDDGLLCFNSISEFDKTLKKYQLEYSGYNKQDEINDLKYNIGDWAYQGFSNLGDAPGYNVRLYNKFYNLGFYGGSDEELKTTKYYMAMTKVIRTLENRGVFECVQTTDDFKKLVVIGND